MWSQLGQESCTGIRSWGYVAREMISTMTTPIKKMAAHIKNIRAK
jgi:hypothetical protein